MKNPISTGWTIAIITAVHAMFILGGVCLLNTPYWFLGLATAIAAAISLVHYASYTDKEWD